MTAQGVPPPNLPLSSSDGKSDPNMNNSSSDGVVKKSEDNKAAEEPVLSPPNLSSEVPDNKGLDQPLKIGEVPGGGIDAPDPLLDNDEVGIDKVVNDPQPKEVKQDIVEEGSSLPESPMPAQSDPGSVPENVASNEEVATPQRMAETTPLAPTSFREPSMPHKKKRQWVLVVGGIVIIIIMGIAGVVVARFFVGAGEESTDVTSEMVGNEETSRNEEQNTVVDTEDVIVDETSTNEDEESVSSETEVITSEDAVLDGDEDGLTIAEERFYGTDVEVADTDGDGYADGEEVRAGYDPLGPGKLDSDNDGFPDPDEREFGSDPFNPDTDGDGFTDGDEIKNGHNPLIPSPGDKL
jgi:hypothetical protein